MNNVFIGVVSGIEEAIQEFKKETLFNCWKAIVTCILMGQIMLFAMSNLLTDILPNINVWAFIDWLLKLVVVLGALFAGSFGMVSLITAVVTIASLIDRR